MFYKKLPPVKLLREELDYDFKTGILTRKSGPYAGKITYTNGRQRILGVYGSYFVASRIIWCFVTGEDPGNCEIDHIDQNPLNDRWQNLRKLQPVQNKWNKPKYQNNKTGFKGVFIRKNQKGVQYWARISARNIRYYDGPHQSAAAAAIAYTKLSRQHHEKYGAPL